MWVDSLDDAMSRSREVEKLTFLSQTSAARPVIARCCRFEATVEPYFDPKEAGDGVEVEMDLGRIVAVEGFVEWLVKGTVEGKDVEN